jgi:hypothetical protein
MAEDIKPGDLVFLTQDYENYVYTRNPKMSIGLVNRLAKLEEIIDWNSPKGQKIKEFRVQSGKWKDLPLEDNKYIFSIYYHDIIGRNDKAGIIEPEPMFSKDPKTGAPFFVKVPDWIYQEILKKCKTFEVEHK